MVSRRTPLIRWLAAIGGLLLGLSALLTVLFGTDGVLKAFEQGDERPDLLVAPDSPLCPIVQNPVVRGDALRLTIQNLGDSDSPPFLVLVQTATGAGEANFPGAPANGKAEVIAEPPPGCTKTDCLASIQVDSEDSVDETREANNTFLAACPIIDSPPN